VPAEPADTTEASGAGGTDAAPDNAGADAGADGPDWATVEQDLEAEVAGSESADADPGAASTACGGGVAAALGVLVATSDTNEFVGNANVELTLVEAEEAGGEQEGDAAAPGAASGAPEGGGAGGSGNGGAAGAPAGDGDGAAAGDGAGGDGAAEEAPQRKPPDHTKPTKANSGSAVWKPFSPAGDYFINIPVLPEDYQDTHFPTPFDEYTVTVAEGGTATKIVFIHPKPWIEIKLLDSVGEPAKGHAYRLELPIPEDAEEGAQPVVLKEGQLDDDGFARVTQDDVNPGTDLAECNVIFPTVSAADVVEAVVDDPSWIKIELLDTLGRPARYWRYEVYAQGNADGAPDYSGTLDAIGRAIVMGDETLDQCEITFLPPLADEGLDEDAEPGDWIRIELQNTVGEPAAHWRYEVFVVESASRYTGTLDMTGQAIVPIVSGEACEISFLPPVD